MNISKTLNEIEVTIKVDRQVIADVKRHMSPVNEYSGRHTIN